MGLLNWLKGRQQGQESTGGSTQQPAESQHPSNPSEKEVFESPFLLADWVNRFFLQSRPIEDDYKLLPDDQTRKNLNITIEQRERCVREFSLLRIVGVSVFVKQQYADDFWLAYSSRIVSHLCEHMHGTRGEGQALNVAKALEAYVDAITSEDIDRCSKTYMTRVYDDSDNFYKLTLGGIGYVSTEFISDSYEIFRNIYYQVTQGMSYQSVKVIAEAIETVNASKA